MRADTGDQKSLSAHLNFLSTFSLSEVGFEDASNSEHVSFILLLACCLLLAFDTVNHSILIGKLAIGMSWIRA